MKELLAFIKEQDQRLIAAGGSSTQSERILARTVKLGEEFGELCDEVLGAQGDQRKEKLNQRDQDGLAKEFADIMLATLLLARAMDVNIEEALALKISKIRNRDVARSARS